MERRNAVVLRAGEIRDKGRWFSQRLNPNSRFRGSGLAGPGGLTKFGLSFVTLPPGKESFAYHAHDVQEEWMFMLSGHAIALIAGVETEVGPGDFIAFPAPQVPHLVINRSSEDVTYLMGGDRPAIDVLHYPTLGEKYMLRGEEGRAAFYKLDTPVHPFGPATDE